MSTTRKARSSRRRLLANVKAAGTAMQTPNPSHPASILRRVWGFLRLASGDDAYERYLDHWQSHHDGQGEPLDRGAFHTAELHRRWNGVRRCC